MGKFYKNELLLINFYRLLVALLERGKPIISVCSQNEEQWTTLLEALFNGQGAGRQTRPISEQCRRDKVVGRLFQTHCQPQSNWSYWLGLPRDERYEYWDKLSWDQSFQNPLLPEGPGVAGGRISDESGDITWVNGVTVKGILRPCGHHTSWIYWYWLVIRTWNGLPAHFKDVGIYDFTV